MDYVGSTKNMKARWSQHKRDIREGNHTACGLTAHFCQHHRNNMEEKISNLKITLVDSVNHVKHLKKREDEWICNLGTLFGGLNTKNEVLGGSKGKNADMLI